MNYWQSENGLIRLHCGDCMPAMKAMGDGEFDLACVDHQYGDQCNLQGGISRHGSHGWSKVFATIDKWNDTPIHPDYFKELARVSKDQIVWGGNYFAHLLQPSMGWIFWDKVQRDFTLAHGELAWTSFDKALRVFTYARGNESGFAPLLPIEQKAFANIHPTQKPVALYHWLLTNYAKPGQTILDTHLGSGSIAIACHNMGFSLTGYEIDEDYFEAAVKRIENHIRQGRLF